jgi:hypothetical protein
MDNCDALEGCLSVINEEGEIIFIWKKCMHLIGDDMTVQGNHMEYYSGQGCGSGHER